MKQSIKIQTVSQWYLLKQLNENGFFKKRKIPNEVMRVMLRILYSRTLGKDGFIVLSLKKIQDDSIGIEEMVNLYPYRLWLEERIEEIPTRTKNGMIQNWYMTHAKVKGQTTQVKIIYTIKESS